MKQLGGILVAAIAVAWAPAAYAQSLCGSWYAVSLPESDGRRLVSISATSPADLWAVGRGVYHWDGVSWSPVPAPGLGAPDTVFNAVAAVAPEDAWIVGFTAFLGTPQTLVERWDGERWSVVSSPVIPGGSEFDAVAALNAHDAWAVGDRAGGHPDFEGTRVTLTAHWDGFQWSAVPSPNISNRSHSLLDVTMIASDDVWAVGYFRNIGENYQSLILHWDGSTWSITPSPNHPGENILFGVSGTSTDDVWAVGDAWDGVTSRQVFLHWDGSSWSQVTGPGGATACLGCSGDVLAMAPNDVWAVGSSIGHWNGSEWTLVPDPEVSGAAGIALRSLAKVGDCDAWAVGSSYDAELAERALSAHLTTDGGTVPTVSVAEGQPRMALRARPNPSRGETLLALTLPTAEHVRISILDSSGRRIRDLASKELEPGEHSIRWDGRDAAGRAVGAGIYFVTATAGDQRCSARVLRMR